LLQTRFTISAHFFAPSQVARCTLQVAAINRSTDQAIKRAKATDAAMSKSFKNSRKAQRKLVKGCEEAQYQYHYQFHYQYQYQSMANDGCWLHSEMTKQLKNN